MLSDDFRGDAESDGRRAAILRAARDEFCRVGFDATKIERVARIAVVSTATVYQLFEGKAQLFVLVVEAAALEVAEKSQSVRPGKGPARERLTEFARRYAAYMGDPSVWSIFCLVMAERSRFGEVAARFNALYKADFGKTLIDALRELEGNGELELDRASWAAGQFLGMIEHSVFFVPIVRGQNAPIRAGQEIADDAVETFLARYGVQRSAPPPASSLRLHGVEPVNPTS